MFQQFIFHTSLAAKKTFYYVTKHHPNRQLWKFLQERGHYMIGEFANFVRECRVKIQDAREGRLIDGGIVLQSGAVYHSQGFEDKNLGSSPGLLGQ